jgi:hypothetical protein
MPRSEKLAKVGALLDRALAKRMNAKPRLDETTLEMAQVYWYVDATKAKEELGWAPRDPHDTLTETVNDLRERLRQGHREQEQAGGAYQHSQEGMKQVDIFRIGANSPGRQRSGSHSRQKSDQQFHDASPRCYGFYSVGQPQLHRT